jgi:tetratricopeptide (TPR) repeat protein
MIDDYTDFDDALDDSSQEPYPDFFYEWDRSLTENIHLRFMDADDLLDIIDIYLSEENVEKARQTIQYSLKLHPGNEDLIYDILLFLNDYELWNDLLTLSDQYQNIPELWVKAHKLNALLHLGMEEDAFLLFRKMKIIYEHDTENFSMSYQVMGEALHEVDLYEASIHVMEEAITLIGPELDFYWQQLQSYISLNLKDRALALAEKILKINPMDGEIWHRLGKSYLSLHETEKAIDAFEFAESLGYRKPSNFLNMIRAYEENGNHLRALEKTKEFLLLYPENYLINILAADICSSMEMWEEALVYVDAALKVLPKMDTLYLYKSNFFLNLGEQKKAMLALEEGIKQTNDSEGDLKKELERLHNQYPNF